VTPKVLEHLKTDEFAVKFGFISNPAAVRRLLLKSNEIADVRRALNQGEISEGSVRTFVNDLVKDFRSGEHFPHDSALSAIAVSLEYRATPFADEFINDLASLRIAELGHSVHIARECKKNRKHLSRTTTKYFILKSKPFEKNGLRFEEFIVPSNPGTLTKNYVVNDYQFGKAA